MRLKHATVLITGGSSGIGLELARQLIARDNTVIIVGRRRAALEAAQAATPDLHIAVCDVSRPEAVANLYAELADAFPALNVLINCAGAMRRLDLRADLSPGDLTSEIDVNLKGPMWTTARFLPLLQTQAEAAIVNVTSAVAYVPMAIAPAYSASQAGLRAYTRALRAQLAASGVQVFEIAPPATATPLHDRFAGGHGLAPALARAVAQAAIASIEKDVFETAIGPARLVRLLGRFAPRFAFARINDAAVAKMAAERNGDRRSARTDRRLWKRISPSGTPGGASGRSGSGARMAS